MLKSFRLPKKKQSKSSFDTEGPIVLSHGSSSKCGTKHDNEDRSVRITAAEALGDEVQPLVSFSDMLLFEPTFVDLEDLTIVGIFDGHGGSKTADFLSKNLHRHISQMISTESRKFEDLSAPVIDGFKACEDALNEKLPKENSGSCVAMTVIHRNKVLVAHSGDCRAVLYVAGEIKQLTTDHRPSDPNEFKRIMENGGRIENGRLYGVLAPSRCFGDNDVRSRIPEGVLISEPSVSSCEVDEQKIRTKTCFMIVATDGVWDAMNNEAACEIVAKALIKNGNNPEVAAAKLVEEASKKTADDVTVSIVLWGTSTWESYSGIGRDSSGVEPEKM
jgi:protein phosphatase 1L